MKHKYLLTFVVLLITSSFLYWLKSELNIDLFKSWALSNQWPFEYLQKDVIIAEPEPGILINESFNSYHITDNWVLRMREKGKISQEYDENETNNSRCPLIKSLSEKSWAFMYSYLIEVRKG